MIHLPEGTTKFLLLDHKVIERNAQRRRASAPAAVVYHVQEDGAVVKILGHGVTTEGPVELTYDPHGFAVNRHRDKHRAAYSTTSAVSIAEAEQEVIAAALDAIVVVEGIKDEDFVAEPAAAPEPKAPATKAKKTK